MVTQPPAGISGKAPSLRHPIHDRYYPKYTFIHTDRSRNPPTNRSEASDRKLRTSIQIKKGETYRLDQSPSLRIKELMPKYRP
jgi:hypothetical protein